jgi:hypothetical protein
MLSIFTGQSIFISFMTLFTGVNLFQTELFPVNFADKKYRRRKMPSFPLNESPSPLYESSKDFAVSQLEVLTGHDLTRSL